MNNNNTSNQQEITDEVLVSLSQLYAESIHLHALSISTSRVIDKSSNAPTNHSVAKILSSLEKCVQFKIKLKLNDEDVNALLQELLNINNQEYLAKFAEHCHILKLSTHKLFHLLTLRLAAMDSLVHVCKFLGPLHLEGFALYAYFKQKNLCDDKIIAGLILTYLESGLQEIMEYLRELYIKETASFNQALANPKLSKYQAFLQYSINNNFPSHLNDIYKFNSGFGKIDFQGMLLACAAVAQNKQHFKPIVLANEQELKQLFVYLEMYEQQLQGQILRIMCILPNDDDSYHFVSGVIKCDHENNKVVFHDSVGEDYVTNLIIECAGSFAKPEFLYLPATSQQLIRQSTRKGCSMFALNDTRNSYTLEENELFKNKFPLKLLRIMQRLDDVEDVKQQYPNELSKPLNKSHKTFEECLFIKPVKDGKSGNKRLDLKLQNITDKVLDLFVNYTADEIDLAKSKFTLEEFIANINLSLKIKPKTRCG